MVTKMMRAAAARNARLTSGTTGRFRGQGDSGSLIFALLLVFLGTALAGLMTPVLLIALNGTRADQRRVTALAAAQAGIDVIVGQIRAANDGASANNGVLSLLPCGTLSGSVGVGGAARYQVTVNYYTTDPKGQSASWLSANAIQCVAGAGARSAPLYGYMQSLGTDQAAGSFSTIPVRTLQATYLFKASNQNIAGGLIRAYKTSTSNDLCFDAGSSSPTAGTSLTMKTCSTGSASQTWAYTTNLTISLVSTKTSAFPNGSMCLDAGSNHRTGNLVKVQPCAVGVSWEQQWSLNESANFAGALPDDSNLDSYCFNVQTQNVSGSYVILSTNCGGGYDNIQTFQPEAAVGAGQAGTASGQLVNYNQFGRCMDIPDYSLSYGYMIAWPCKQNPNPTAVGYNQRWTLPAIASGQTSATGKITTTNDSGQLLCLQSPQSVAANTYVAPVTCSAGSTNTNLIWTVTGGNNGDYTTSYRIKDSTTGTPGNVGYCMQPTDPSAPAPDLFPKGSNISKIILGLCSGSTMQKWNAPPDIGNATPLKDIGEK
jgi:hypothetical protein